MILTLHEEIQRRAGNAIVMDRAWIDSEQFDSFQWAGSQAMRVASRRALERKEKRKKEGHGNMERGRRHFRREATAGNGEKSSAKPRNDSEFTAFRANNYSVDLVAFRASRAP